MEAKVRAVGSKRRSKELKMALREAQEDPRLDHRGF